LQTGLPSIEQIKRDLSALADEDSKEDD